MAEPIGRWATEIQEYCRALANELHPQLVALYGSQATGRARPHSDVDIVVVADSLPADFFERLALLRRLNQTRAPIEPLGYTTTEFEQMLREGEITPLDVVYQGIPLVGEDYFEKLKVIFDDMQRRGLERTWISWKLPTSPG